MKQVRRQGGCGGKTAWTGAVGAGAITFTVFAVLCCYLVVWCSLARMQCLPLPCYLPQVCYPGVKWLVLAVRAITAVYVKQLELLSVFRRNFSSSFEISFLNMMTRYPEENGVIRPEIATDMVMLGCLINPSWYSPASQGKHSSCPHPGLHGHRDRFALCDIVSTLLQLWGWTTRLATGQPWPEQPWPHDLHIFLSFFLFLFPFLEPTFLYLCSLLGTHKTLPSLMVL